MWIGHTCSFKYWKCRRGMLTKIFFWKMQLCRGKTDSTDSKPQGCLKTGGIWFFNEEALHSGRTEFPRVILTLTSKDTRNRIYFLNMFSIFFNHRGLCGLVVRVSGYRYRGPRFDPRRYQIFWVVVSLERGPLSLMRSIEELLEWKK